MRGSPFFRTVCYALVLAATAFGLSQVTSPPPASVQAPVPVVEAAPTFEVPYELTLSTPAREVRLNGRVITTMAGKLALDPADPRVMLAIDWEQAPAAGTRHFAKLVLDPPGKESIVHVFDAVDDFDDVFEPSSAAIQ